MSETVENVGQTDGKTTEETPKRISEVVIVPCEGLDDEEVMRRIESLDMEGQERDGVIYLLLTFPGKATLEDKEDGQLLRLDIAGATDEETEYLIESLNMLTEQYPALGVELNRMAETNIPLTPEQSEKLQDLLGVVDILKEDGEAEDVDIPLTISQAMALREVLGGMDDPQEDGNTQKE